MKVTRSSQVDTGESAALRVGVYTLGPCLGAGATARVYRAQDPNGGEVAVKLLGGSAESKPQIRKRFERETRALARLQHANLLKLLDAGVDPLHGPYLVTPLIAGQTLRRFSADRRLSPGSALTLIEPLLEGLAVMHAAGLVHRDLKPENVLLTRSGRLVLVDLGLVLGSQDTRLTSEGAVVGSIPYMSPEQIEGGAVGPQSDVWSVGVMVYELITGRRPFARQRQSEEVAAICRSEYAGLGQLDRRVGDELSCLIDTCLCPAVSGRPKDAGQLLARLRPLRPKTCPAGRSEAMVELVRNPQAFENALADSERDELQARARAAIETGDGFAALRLLDRALAHRPDDPALAFLVDRATVACAKDPGQGDRKQRWSKGRLTGVFGIGLTIALLTTLPAIWPSSTQAVDSIAIAAHPLTEASTGLPRQESLPHAALASLSPIPESALSDRRPEPVDQIAKPGERLVPAHLFGAAGPQAGLANIEAQMKAKPNDRELPVGRALALIGSGRDRDGLEALDALMTSSPELPVVWASRGFVSLRQGKLDAAEHQFGRAIALDPGRVDALRNRGILRHRLGRVREAYRDLVAAMQADPDDLQAAKELASVYEKTGQRASVLPLLEHITRLAPSDPENWLNLAVVQLDPKQAIASIRRALSLNPASRRGLRMLCTEMTARHDPEAIAACDRAMARLGDQHALRMHRGLAWFHAGDDKRALGDIDQAVAMLPKDAQYRINRHLVRSHAGDAKGAGDDLRAACRLGHEAACQQLANP